VALRNDAEKEEKTKGRSLLLEGGRISDHLYTLEDNKMIVFDQK